MIQVCIGESHKSTEKQVWFTVLHKYGLQSVVYIKSTIYREYLYMYNNMN